MWSNHTFHKTKKCNCTEAGQQYDVGGTAFALLPLLGAGETPRRGRYSKNVLRGLAYLLSRLVYPDFPECLGVFRSVQRPTYEDVVNKQMEDVLATRGPGKLEDLFASDETWTVE